MFYTAGRREIFEVFERIKFLYSTICDNIIYIGLSQGTDNPMDMDYSDLIREIHNNNVSEVALEGQKATVILKSPILLIELIDMLYIYLM